MRWCSALVDVQSFRGAGCDTNHYLVVAKVKERLAISKEATPLSNLLSYGTALRAVDASEFFLWLQLLICVQKWNTKLNNYLF
jgi:hypothetical protein